MKMGDKFLKLTGLGFSCVLAVSLPAFASDKRPSSIASDEHAIRSLISNWVEACKDLDAKRLAARETPEVQVVDRFGVLHLVSGRSENEELWSDSFEAVPRDTVPLAVTIDRIQFLRPDVTVV